MLKVYKLNDKATLPKFATEQSACFDIASSESYIIAPGGTVAISTGLIFDIPLGYSIRLHPVLIISTRVVLDLLCRDRYQFIGTEYHSLK